MFTNRMKSILVHMLDYTTFILKSSTGKTVDDFLCDEMLRLAISMALLNIGEHAKLLPENFREKYSTIPWRSIIGLRNWMVHKYDLLDMEIVWNTVIDDIPSLHTFLTGMTSE